MITGSRIPGLRIALDGTKQLEFTLLDGVEKTWWKRWLGKEGRSQRLRDVICDISAQNVSRSSSHSTEMARELPFEPPPVAQAINVVDDLSSETPIRQAIDVGNFTVPVIPLPDKDQEYEIEPQTATTFENLATLEGLANELIQEIIRLVPWPQTSLSLCSKRLHILIEPFLYTQVSLRHPKSYPWFMRTVSRRPYLASYVRQFHTSAYTADWDFDLDFIADKSWAGRSLPTVFGESACLHWNREIFAFRPKYRMLMAAAWDAITAFLLCLFSELQSIDMKPYGLLVTKYFHIDMVLEQASRDSVMMKSMRQRILSKLRSVSIEDSQEFRALTTTFVLPFLKIKSVSCFRVTNVREGSKLFKHPSVLETADVALLDSYLSARSARQFIPLFNSLRRFQYQYGMTGRQYHDLQPPFPLLKESLLNSRHSLEQLMISDDRCEAQQTLLTNHSAGIGSLRDFTRLSDIKTDANILIGEEYRTIIQDDEVLFEMTRSFDTDQCSNFVHSLPTSLEHLTIWKNTIAIVDCLEHMCPLLGGVFPIRLRSITVFFRTHIASPSDWVMKEWVERASKFGVMLTWERTSKGLPDDQWQKKGLLYCSWVISYLYRA